MYKLKLRSDDEVVQAQNTKLQLPAQASRQQPSEVDEVEPTRHVLLQHHR